MKTQALTVAIVLSLFTGCGKVTSQTSVPSSINSALSAALTAVAVQTLTCNLMQYFASAGNSFPVTYVLTTYADGSVKATCTTAVQYTEYFQSLSCPNSTPYTFTYVDTEPQAYRNLIQLVSTTKTINVSANMQGCNVVNF